MAAVLVKVGIGYFETLVPLGEVAAESASTYVGSCMLANCIQDLKLCASAEPI